MKEKNITLYCVSVILNVNGYVEKHSELTGHQTEKSYVVGKDVEGTLSRKRSKRISKDSLMLPLSKILQSHRTIAYYAYCLPEDKEATLEILRKKTFDLAKTIKEECTKMFSNIPKN